MANEITTYSTTGAREDLTDIIANISPTDTWLTSNSGNVDAKQRYHEWQTDVLKTPGVNAVAEGSTATNSTYTASTRLGNYTQSLRAVFEITDTTEATTLAGRKSEQAYETAKALKEIANDIEYALLINAAAASASAGSARTMKGAIGFVATNTAVSAASGTATACEAKFNDILQLVWAAGGKPSTLLCGGAMKRIISSFNGNTTKFNSMDDASLQAAVDVYRSDFGAIKLQLSTIMSAASAAEGLIFGDMGLWRKAWLRKPKTEELARTGSSRRWMVETELTLEALNEKGAGKVKFS